ncbi:MAG: helix-turn-helix domain-containing protein [Pseudomonadales bacterium]
MTLGRAIRERRLSIRATLEEIAHRAGIDASNLSRIERDMQAPSAMCLYRIAEALNTPLSSLLGEKPPESTQEQAHAMERARTNDRQTDALLRIFYRLNDEDRALAIELIRALDKQRRG